MNKTSVRIGLINPKSPMNVGSIMRAAGCFNVDSVYYTGQRYSHAAKFNTDTKNAATDIPLIGVDNLLEFIPEKVKIISIELVEDAVPLPAFQHPENAFYIFGPEDGTLSQAIIDRSDSVVYIPTTGCMNLAATVNVVLYDRMAKSTDINTNNDLIRSSRDTNNRTKIKRAVP